MLGTAAGAKVTVTALQAQFGVSTASPDAGGGGGGAPRGVMDRIVVVHVDGRIALQGEVGGVSVGDDASVTNRGDV